MKTMLFLAVFAASSAHAASMFSPSQEHRVLDAVKRACANTWCEGDYEYDFKKFHCEKRKCSLDFDIITFKKFDEDGKADPASAERYETRCDFSPVKKLGDVLNFKRNYITAEYFKSLAECIDENASAIGVPASQEPKEPKPDMPLPVEAKENSGLSASPTMVFQSDPVGESAEKGGKAALPLGNAP